MYYLSDSIEVISAFWRLAIYVGSCNLFRHLVGKTHELMSWCCNMMDIPSILCFNFFRIFSKLENTFDMKYIFLNLVFAYTNYTNFLYNKCSSFSMLFSIGRNVIFSHIFTYFSYRSIWYFIASSSEIYWSECLEFIANSSRLFSPLSLIISFYSHFSNYSSWESNNRYAFY